MIDNYDNPRPDWQKNDCAGGDWLDAGHDGDVFMPVERWACDCEHWLARFRRCGTVVDSTNCGAGECTCEDGWPLQKHMQTCPMRTAEPARKDYVDTDEHGLDDAMVTAPKLFRMERMENGAFWIRVERQDGSALVVRPHTRRGALIIALVEEE
jgi:hypothetical protein